MANHPVSDRERRRKRAMIVFQALLYSYLLGLFLVQAYMYSVRDW